PMIGAFVGVLVGYIVLYSLFVALIGEAAAALVMVLLVFGSLVWVYIDASALKTDQGQVTGFVNMSPGRWTFACFLIWIVAFPIYLVARAEIQKANERHP